MQLFYKIAHLKFRTKSNQTSLSMKKLLLASLFTLSLTFAQAQTAIKWEWKQMTAIESVVPGGLGRSRLITTDTKGEVVEIKLENFFSLVGINFGNIKDNDRIITESIQKMSDEGWELHTTNSGVYGNENSTGIFVTRYLFRRKKQ
jgi:hypothetical protein